ncbi:methionine-rich copper-binding protein CopC [Aeromicrobium panaciterrae]|uniref:Methionine-rich copper-binding protein CopC n=1 Tax=Aeromicrobium panaciterrae TaxID=363861 RepID=A0ABU1UNW1_9ACTN|nr:copper resistance protein CopC [Aeromicrobium panaciterrae]MDR7086871.1 methionine-rich copper-binding protein CopC [Aeromicrobium panaciterrae]
MTRANRDPSRLATRVALVTMIGLFLGVGPASAHGLLISSTPEDDSLINTSPTSISLTFHDYLGEQAKVAVWSPNGSAVKVLTTAVVRNTVTVTVDPTDQRGRYAADYRVESTDGLPLEGSIHWTTATGRQVKQVAHNDVDLDQPSGSNFYWGFLAALVPVALLIAGLRLAALRGRDDKGNA